MPDEDDDAEVGIETVADEERREDNEPGKPSWKEITLYLEHKEDRKDSEADQPDPDLKDRDPQPPQQLLLPEEHVACLLHHHTPHVQTAVISGPNLFL